MKELLEQGIGLLTLTPDYTEVLEMSHRIIVLRNKHVCKKYQHGEPIEAEI
jgi:ABC-type sugar transport system ATPase subunit